MGLISQTDKDLIDKVAKLWIENGGDAEGILWTYKDIYNRVKELESGESEQHQ
jgi:hypothetical protein